MKCVVWQVGKSGGRDNSVSNAVSISSTAETRSLAGLSHSALLSSPLLRSAFRPLFEHDAVSRSPLTVFLDVYPESTRRNTDNKYSNTVRCLAQRNEERASGGGNRELARKIKLLDASTTRHSARIQIYLYYYFQVSPRSAKPPNLPRRTKEKRKSLFASPGPYLMMVVVGGWQ